jgi:hypothetical protein
MKWPPGVTLRPAAEALASNITLMGLPSDHNTDKPSNGQAGPVAGGLVERLWGAERAAHELRRVREQERRQLLAAVTRCADCDPLVCGIDDCPGHQAADRLRAASAEAEAQRQFIIEVVQDYLATVLPDAVRYLVEHGGCHG